MTRISSGKIKHLQAREILDSRGNPTIETQVQLRDGSVGVSAVPSGASTGKYEAVELRDRDPDRFNGMGVLKAVKVVQQRIAPLLMGLEADKQAVIDKLMIDLDGTPNKRRLGANALLSVSQALVKAAALSLKQPVYRYLLQTYGLSKKPVLPTPIFNILNAGRHGPSSLEFQEFIVIPQHQRSFAKNLEAGQAIYVALRELLAAKGLSTALGDEGGFSPNLLSNLDGLEMVRRAIRRAGYKPGTSAALGLDVAASEFFRKGKYKISDFSRPITAETLITYYEKVSQRFPLIFLEDGLEQDSWQEWQQLTHRLGSERLSIVGDDFLVTNPLRVAKAIETQACNAVLVKPNQIGTITETMQVIGLAKKAGWKTVISHRSGETNDAFVADLAVAVGADFVKFGAPARGERVAKYNRLLQIEQELARK
jgi:enolase